MTRAGYLLVLLAIALTACSSDPAGNAGRAGGPASAGGRHHGAHGDRPSERRTTAVAAGTTRRVDPRSGGLDIGLAEWALTPEASAIRPGPVTFVIANKGTMAHGFEIELEGDSSGSGSGDLFKTETALLQPGETTRLRLDLPPGLYKIECLVHGHDDRGMEDLLEVRAGAPLQKRHEERPAGQISIAELAFSPAVARVPAGTEVSWENQDPTQHTVTADDGAFASDTLDPGDTFSFRAEDPGVYAYRCAIHPEMKAVLRVR